MRVLVIGATGTIGKPVVAALKAKGHEVVEASRSNAQLKVDLMEPATLRALFDTVGRVDAIVSVAGGGKWAPMEQLSDDDYEYSLHNKLMGQVNVIRYGLRHVSDGGSITVTSGELAHKPMQGSTAVSLINAGLEGFTRAAALEAPRGVRVNCVRPPWVGETLEAMGKDPSHGLPADVVARAYVESVEGKQTGHVIDPAEVLVSQK